MAATVAKKLRAHYYRRCDPRESLSPGDDRLVVDATIAKARGRDWVDTLAESVELSQLAEGRAYELFTGLPGSGKSTELLRLKARLEDKESTNLLAVYINAEDVIDLYNTIDIPDILIAILAETERCVLVEEGGNPKNALKDTKLKRFWNWLTETDVELKGLEANVGVKASVPEIAEASIGAKVMIGLKTRPTLRQRVRGILDNQVHSFTSQLQEAIGELNERAQGAGRDGLVVIFDSLEKLQGTVTNWREVLVSAERVFANRADDLRLPVHILYTIPMALILRIKTQVTRLPMLKLKERDGTPAAGYDAAREIVRKRIPDEHLNEFFGAPNREARVKRLIEWSGGYPREIVRLLRSCVAEPSLDETGFELILSTAADEVRRTVLGSEYPLLARVFLDKPSAILDSDDNREGVDRLLQNNILLAYLNGALWYDIHPAVQTLPGVTDEVAKLKATRASASQR
jgi:hypothetical protein